MVMLGRPIMIAFAIRPFLAAIILDRFGAETLLATLIGMVSTNIVIGFTLVRSGGRGA